MAKNNDEKHKIVIGGGGAAGMTLIALPAIKLSCTMARTPPVSCILALMAAALAMAL